ncbi:MAG: 4-hydroxy-tetrahydrodipicolinate reductase [Gemmatimonadaceae bacterium]
MTNESKPTPRLAVIGAGKMGRVITELAGERGWPVVATIGRADDHGRGPINVARLNGADVAVEFTNAASAPSNVRACAQAGCPVVVGTTGWDSEREGVERDVLSANGAMLWSPNFALGVNLFWQVAEIAASLAGHAGFDAYIVEAHHTEKKDAPSGTARELERRVSAAMGRRVPVTSVRSGFIPGTHEIVFDARFEQIRIEHVARDRRVFAEGALVAAEWLATGKRKGVFTMRDVLKLKVGGGGTK